MVGRRPVGRRSRVAAVGIALALAGTALIAPVVVGGTTTFIVNRIGDLPDLNLSNSVCDVSTNTGNQCTLRAAIQEANDTPGPDTINFNITTTSKTITPATPLPVITEEVTINGYSQSGASANTSATGNNAVLKIVLDGINAPADANGLEFDSFKGTVKGLVIQRFDGDGIVITGTKVLVSGCFIGTNAAADAARPNEIGVLVTGPLNFIGGAIPAARNVISGNELTGISLFGPEAEGNSVVGNFIGTKKGGGAALANGLDGVRVISAPSNGIGSPSVAGRNIISGNAQNGIYGDDADNLSVFGNYIGTNAAGTADLGNGQNGVFVERSSGLSIGAQMDGAGNVISGNTAAGIAFNEVAGSSIYGNKIGTNAAGTAGLGNSGRGIFLLASDSITIGAGNNLGRNTISANLGGIELDTDGSTVRGNRIGTKADGTGNLGNQFNGINISGTSNIIGGTGADGNVIANSVQEDGIAIGVSGANDNTIQGNSITGNHKRGVRINVGPNQVLGNVIVANGEEGVKVGVITGSTVGVRISGNQIFANGKLGINLDKLGDLADGVTANDSGDGDGGPNNSQNFPVLTQALRQSNGVTTVSGSLNSIASTQFRIELFLAVADPTGHGEAQVLLAAQNITTGTGGNKTFAFSLGNLSQGQQLTATAIRTGNGDTSEFSTNVTVINAP